MDRCPRMFSAVNPGEIRENARIHMFFGTNESPNLDFFGKPKSFYYTYFVTVFYQLFIKISNNNLFRQFYSKNKLKNKILFENF